VTRLPGMPSLDALLDEPGRVAEVPAEVVPALLDQLAIEIDRRDRLQALLLDRLRPTATVEHEQLLDIDAAAARLAVTPDWLRRRPDLPFRVALSDGTVRYSARGIDQHICKLTKG